MNAASRDKDRETRPGDETEHHHVSDAHSHRMDLLFEHMLEGYAYCRLLFDDSGEPDDFVYLEVNEAFGTLTGLSDVLGRRVTEVLPGFKESNPEVLEAYARVVRTGEPERLEVEVDQLGIVLTIMVFRPEPGHFAAVFDNITERKVAERKLEELVRFLEYRLEERSTDLAEALRIADRTHGRD